MPTPQTTTKPGRKPVRREKTQKPQEASAPPQERTPPRGRQRYPSVTLQVRVAPPLKAFADRLAEQHQIPGRSKLDPVIYARGLWLTALLLGPADDGSYAGLSEQELARKLAPLFDRLYGVLDTHQLLASYVYRVLPHGLAGLTVLPTGGAAMTAGTEPHVEQPDANETYQLSDDAQASLENFAEEI